MSEGQGAGSGVHAASTGQLMTGAAWLDVHFEACRPEYEAMLRSVGLRPGWRVLDAGCGSGSYPPSIAGAVGPDGAISALDLAPDNVAAVERRVATWGLATRVAARAGNVLALPYGDDCFDAIWFAATAQYLSDDELIAALAEFRRVVRPGGLVALKDYDGTMMRFLPAPPYIFSHLFEAVALGGLAQAAACLRVPSLGAWLRRAGLVERSAPLRPVERQLCDDLFAFWASLAPDYDLPAAERMLWERLDDPAERARLLDDPDFSCCEGHVVAVGRVY